MGEMWGGGTVARVYLFLYIVFRSAFSLPSELIKVFECVIYISFYKNKKINIFIDCFNILYLKT